MPRPASIALALVLLAVLAVCGFALYIASTIARPHGNSLTEERRWEQDHGLWGDFESLERTAYVAPGKDGYELHCELVSAPEPSDRYVIISHGFRANRYGAAKYVGAGGASATTASSMTYAPTERTHLPPAPWARPSRRTS